jgi:AmmeMemoRadiSam system protein B
MTNVKNREMSVAGSFYPDKQEELLAFIEHFNSLAEDTTLSSKAVIVPHAGYVYSGYTANLAYKVLKNSSIKNFLVLGPSHKVAFEGSSVCSFENYDTPLREIASELSMSDALREKFNINSFEDAHHEHSTEVQFPFIKHYIPDANIVELVYSKQNPAELAKVIKYIYEQEDWGVVISTDLSHFYNQEDANKLDNICIDAVKNLDVDLLHKGCEACGIIGVEAMMIVAKELGLEPNILDYRTSADASEDLTSVVGYLSACFTSS